MCVCVFVNVCVRRFIYKRCQRGAVQIKVLRSCTVLRVTVLQIQLQQRMAELVA